MLKTLVNKQLTEIFRTYFYDAKNNKARNRGAVIAYIAMFIILMVGVMGGIFTWLAHLIASSLLPLKLDWMYFCLMGLMSILLGAFGSVFNTYSGLYLAKDNDLLLSMPIPINYIMVSRLLTVYFMGLMYSAVISIPTSVIYMVLHGFSLGLFLSSILYVLIISLFVLDISCGLGWIVAKISVKLKNKSFITVIVSLAFIIAYYFFYFKAQSILSSFLANAVIYGEKIKGAVYPLYIFGMSGFGDIPSLIICTISVISITLLVWAMISRSFIKLATSSGNTEHRTQKAIVFSKKSKNSALLIKELGKFISNPTYMLNCGLGTFVLVLCSGAILILKDRMAIMLEVFDGDTAAIAVIICTGICVMSSMNTMTTPSISLESKTLWLIQSLPIDLWYVLRAKLMLQLILTENPVVLVSVLCGLVFEFSFIETFLVLITSTMFSFLMAMFDLFIGLKMPNLHWTNKITPIKQSAGVMITMLVGMIFSIIPGVLFFVLYSYIAFSLFMLIVSLLFAIIGIIFYTHG